MRCERCHGKTATVHFTKITNGRKSEEYLCQDCACEGYDMMDVFHQENSFMALDSSLLSFLKNVAPELSWSQPNKGGSMRYRSLDESAAKRAHKDMLGSDYISFREKLRPFFGSKKDGKRKKEISSQDQYLHQLEMKLQDSIQTEDYEEAARLRDEIQKYKDGKG